ncbi:MAG: ribosome silencing factor [Geminicoccaceae bacterium]|nr:MAG: ribosome silencing factor [Geminicoccaceae bacterium]
MVAGAERRRRVIDEALNDGVVKAAAEDVLALIERSLDDDKAVDPVTIDLAGKTALADAMVVASGTSQRHIGAMADKLLERLKDAGVQGVLKEGGAESDWVLIDTGDVIVHLFKPETRDFYGIEKLWASPRSRQQASA